MTKQPPAIQRLIAHYATSGASKVEIEADLLASKNAEAFPDVGLIATYLFAQAAANGGPKSRPRPRGEKNRIPVDEDDVRPTPGGPIGKVRAVPMVPIKEGGAR